MTCYTNLYSLIMSNKYISVITTSFNCSQYIENTIQSITGQNYSGLQYIVVDALSTDGTDVILDKYKDSIDIVIRESDEGMYHGIQKGAGYVEGEIMAWLNADDAYLPWTFSVVENIFKRFPEVDWIIGQPSYLNQKGQCVKVASNAGAAYPGEYIRNGWFRPQFAGHLQQESMFWRKSLWDRAGGLNLDLHLAADFELWTRFAQYAELYSVATPLASFRRRPGEQKSSIGSDKYCSEVKNVCEGLPSPGKIWDFISKRGDAQRILSRLLVWKRSKVIVFSLRKNEWIIEEMYRPLSRHSFSDVFLEHKSRL